MHDHLLFFTQLLVLLLSSRLLGEVFRALRQPVVVGELLAGVAVGPSLLGAVAPDFHRALFPAPAGGMLPPGLDGFALLGVTLLMLVAGLEVDLGLLRRHGRLTLSCALFGSVVPLAFGVLAGWFFWDLWGVGEKESRFLFALVLGISLAMSALPVIAKTLLDLGIYRTRVGAVVLSAAMIDDLGVWILFSMAMGFLGQGPIEGRTPWVMGVLTIAMVVGTLTVGRWAVNASLPFVQGRLSWPGGLVALTVGAGLAMGGLAILVGVHPVFGSLLAGIAIGSSPRLKPGSKELVYGFVMSVFAPIFFASIGLRMDLRRDLDLALTAWTLLLGCLGKVVGAYAGARLGGMDLRESWAVAVGLNSRGIMGIVLGLVALEAKIIHQAMFVALAVLGIATSLISGPLLRLILGRRFFDEQGGPTPSDEREESSTRIVR